MMMVIDVRLLGGFRVSVDKQCVESLSSHRSQSLFARLVLQVDGAPLSRAFLAGLLWPESSDQQARTNLRREFHKLRQCHKAIDQSIHADQNVLSWTPSTQCNVDVHRLDELSTETAKSDSVAKRVLGATELAQFYKGHFLPGVTDDWVLEQRDEILRTYLATCEQLAQSLIYDGEHAKAISLYEAVVAQDSLNESAWLRLMELHLSSNDHARAIRTYHRCASALRQELDVAPSEPLRLLYRKLTEGDGAAMPDTMPLRSVRPDPPVATRMLGRQKQQIELQACWREITRGGIKLVVIKGDAGIGKTRLADAFLQRLHVAGTPVARSRAYAAEGSLPFSAVKDWLRTEPIRTATSKLPGPALDILQKVFPEITAGKTSSREMNKRPAQTIETEQNLQRLAMFEAMADAIVASGDRLVLFLDDIQWCDTDTLQWLRFLHRHAPSHPVMILTTARSDVLVEQHPVTMLMNELSVHEQVVSISVGALEEAEARELMAHEQQAADPEKPLSPAETDRILERAEGNPLFIVELVRATLSAQHPTGPGLGDSAQQLSDKVYAVIQYRLSGLSQNAQNVARMAATIGRQFSDQLLTAASGLTENAMIDAIDELWQRKVIRADSTGGYVFSHDYIREAAYAQLSPARRKKLHRQVVQALKSIYEDSIELVTGELAFHCECAGLTDEAVQWYREAARHLQTRFAYNEAIDSLEKGLALLGATRGLHKSTDRQVEMLVLVGNYSQVLNGFTSPQIQDICQRLKKLLSQVESPGLRIDALERFRRYYANVDVTEAIRLAEEQITLSRELGDDVRSLSAHRSLGFSLFQGGDQVAADATMAQAHHVIRRTTQPAMGDADRPHFEIPLATGLWANILAMRAQTNHSRQIDAQARACPIEHLPIVAQAFARHFRMQNDILHHKPARALQCAAWAADVARRYDFANARMWSLYYSGWAHGALGDPERAIDELLRALAESRATHSVMYHPQRWAILADNQLALNQLNDAEHSLKQAFAVAKSSNQPFWHSELHRLTARLLQARGENPDSIQAALSLAITTSEQQGATLLWLRAMLEQARLWLELSQISKAHQALNDLIEQQTPRGTCFELKQAKALLAKISPEPATLS